MILRNTILSVFNDRGTLLKWIKKLEQEINEHTVNDIQLFTSTVTLGATADGITISGASTVNGDEVTSSLRIPLVGSDTIVLDVGEDASHFELHLDGEIVEKLQRTLLTPMTTPASTQLVAVNTAGAQEMLTLGNGLSVSDGVISASGGGGGTSVGTILYIHLFTPSDPTYPTIAVTDMSGASWTSTLEAEGLTLNPTYLFSLVGSNMVNIKFRMMISGGTFSDIVSMSLPQSSTIRYHYYAGGEIQYKDLPASLTFTETVQPIINIA